MKEINLTQGMIALVDDEDFSELNKYKWYPSAYTKSKTTYAYTCEGYFMHRMVMGITDKGLVVDHIDHNGLNNQKNNLRIITQSQNMMNRSSLQTNNKSGYQGVCWDKRRNKWKSYIKINRKLINLGRFKDKEEAARAYDKKAKELFGEFCGNLNFPNE